MALYAIASENLNEIKPTTFDEAGLFERYDLQRLIRKQIDVISPDILIIGEEFGDWDDSRRRIDLLGIDRDANIVVIELKRTEDGGHMELQALRYAAMVSAMEFDEAVSIFEKYLRSDGDLETDARLEILKFVGWDGPEDGSFGKFVRIILASLNFSKELTSTVLWLNNQGIDISCYRLIPHDDSNGRVLLDISQIIPLPEAADYQIKIRKKEQNERIERKIKSGDEILPRFWEGLLALDMPKSRFTAKMTRGTRSYMGARSELSAAAYYYNVFKDASRIDMYIDGGGVENNKRIFDALHSHKQDIEAALGEELIWDRIDDKRACRIAWPLKTGGYTCAEEEWPSLQGVMVEAMIRFENAFSPYVRELAGINIRR